MKRGRRWLLLSVTLCAAATAGPPPPPEGARQPPSADAPDSDFIEFLGADDVGDAAWWEYLKRTAPNAEDPPAPPPQDAKQ